MNKSVIFVNKLCGFGDLVPFFDHLGGKRCAFAAVAAVALVALCQSSFTTLVGPGLAISNSTEFCKEPSSAVNVAVSNATYELFTGLSEQAAPL